jgi:hypothetical protein
VKCPEPLPAPFPDSHTLAGCGDGCENDANAASAAAALDPVKAELFAMLARRLALLKSLVASLLRSRDAIVGLDLDGIYNSVAEQQSLCGELRKLQTALLCQPGGAGRTPEDGVTLPSFSSAELERVAALRREMGEVERDLRRQARVNSSLLRRCGRTAACLRTLYQSCLGTYADPAITGQAARTSQR